MTKPFLLLLLLSLLLTFQTFAQAGKTKAKDPFLQKTERVKQLLTAYHALTPKPGDANMAKAIVAVQGQIKTQLLEVLNDKKILNYKPEEVLNHEELGITKSDDNRVYVLSIAEKATDTISTYLNFLHYRPQEGAPRAEFLSGDRFEPAYIARYTSVYLFDNATSTYLAFGKVSTCENCNTEVAVSIRFAGSASGLELVKQIDYLSGDLFQFGYDPRSKTISYDYRISSTHPFFPGTPTHLKKNYRMKGKLTHNGNYFTETDKQEIAEP